jgi:hypothetical protein
MLMAEFGRALQLACSALRGLFFEKTDNFLPDERICCFLSIPSAVKMNVALEGKGS